MVVYEFQSRIKKLLLCNILMMIIHLRPFFIHFSYNSNSVSFFIVLHHAPTLTTTVNFPQSLLPPPSSGSPQPLTIVLIALLLLLPTIWNFLHLLCLQPLPHPLQAPMLPTHVKNLYQISIQNQNIRFAKNQKEDNHMQLVKPVLQKLTLINAFSKNVCE